MPRSRNSSMNSNRDNPSNFPALPEEILPSEKRETTSHSEMPRWISSWLDPRLSRLLGTRALQVVSAIGNSLFLDKRKMSKFNLKPAQHRNWPQPAQSFADAVVPLI